MKGDLLVPLGLLDRARKIKLFLMDVDGTLTDGGVCLLSLPNDGSGEAHVAELKVFNSLDGIGSTLLTPWESRPALSPGGVLQPFHSARRSATWTWCISDRPAKRKPSKNRCVRLK